MTTNQNKGRLGEEKAAQFLVERGYEIIERNLRIGRAEIDLFVREGDEFAFVEVKTRSSSRFGFPEESVDQRKEKVLIEAANEYCHLHPEVEGVRIDVISVIDANGRCEIRHFKDAIFPWSF